MNPLFNFFDLSKNMLTREGMNFLLYRKIFENQGVDNEHLIRTLDLWQKEAISFLQKSHLLEGLDIEDLNYIKEATSCLNNIDDTFNPVPEKWALHIYENISDFNKLLTENIPQDVASIMIPTIYFSSLRSLLIFHNYLEESTWRGHLMARLEQIIEIWKEEIENSKESYWQKQFSDNFNILSQLFPYPVAIVGEKAYLGGTKVNRSGAQFIDYLIKNDLSQNVLLIEIKTPKTQLLGGNYRKGVYKISAELNGAIIQILHYKQCLLKEYERIRTDMNSFAFNPTCYLFVGNLSKEFNNDPSKRESFELFRSSIKDLQIITYDELLEKMKKQVSFYKTFSENLS